MGNFEPAALTTALEDAAVLFFPMVSGTSLSSFGDMSAVAMASGR
jgi:hypothetical protein